MKALTRNGVLIEEEGMSYLLAEMETDATLALLQSAACTYWMALGRQAGQKVLTPENCAHTKCAATARQKILRQCTWL